jgi:hypothetical protein
MPRIPECGAGVCSQYHDLEFIVVAIDDSSIYDNLCHYCFIYEYRSGNHDEHDYYYVYVYY